ncbi:MAG: glycosyltransferase family 4 protein [Saprospiraceae bacterium]|nr:glycosyltransferase family 4 protein [Saprospiraceae bacterium]
MNILHLSTALSWRGGEQQVAYLMEELALQGVQQFVFCPENSVLHAHCKRLGLGVITYRKTFNLDPFLARRVAKICKTKDITHLHAHDSPAHTFAVMAASLFGLKIPIFVHRRVYVQIGKNWLSKWKYNHPSVHHIICVSDFVRQLITPQLKAPSKLVVVHSCIDLGRFIRYDNAKKINTLRNEFKISHNQYLIGYIAAISPEKDYMTFLEVAEKLIKAGVPATFFAIGGDGGEEEELRYLIHKKSLQKRVLMTGFRNDIPEILPELDILLFTSKSEGLGTSLLDAFASKVPVVASRTGGIPELVENGKTGLLCKVGDVDGFAGAVKSLLDDASYRNRLAENAFQKVQRFGKSKMAEAMLEIYRHS